jgi:hypothetical protein
MSERLVELDAKLFVFGEDAEAEKVSKSDEQEQEADGQQEDEEEEEDEDEGDEEGEGDLDPVEEDMQIAWVCLLLALYLESHKKYYSLFNWITGNA